jgi:hypothetical protein
VRGREGAEKWQIEPREHGDGELAKLKPHLASLTGSGSDNYTGATFRSRWSGLGFEEINLQNTAGRSAGRPVLLGQG